MSRCLTPSRSSPAAPSRPAAASTWNATPTASCSSTACAGDFTYILTSRQMGKSSLMYPRRRTARGCGALPVIIDLTELVRRRAGELGDDARGRLRARAPDSTSLRTASTAAGSSAGALRARRRRRARSRRAGLAPRSVAASSAARAADDLLVQLRQLAADGDGALGVELGEHASDAPTRRGDSNATTVSGARETASSGAALAREEAGEAPDVGRQRARDERGDRRRRPGSTSTASPAATQPWTSA